MRSRDPDSDLVRVVPELRSLVEFRRLNFMDADFGLTETPEIIFCRNVIIYFDRPTQVSILQKLTRHLAPGGYFFVRPLRVAAGHGPAADPGRSGGLQESRWSKLNCDLPEI